MPEDNHRAIIYAHRGANGNAPENTLAAFKLAVEQGADGIEMDVRLTADGEVVVMHDETVDRTTNGKGRVRKLTLDELKRLDAGSFFSRDFAGERVPTLREVFSSLNCAVRYNLELTDYRDLFGPLAEKVVRLVQEYSIQERVIFTSFNPYALHAARKLLPEAEFGLLAFRGARGAVQRSFIGRWLAPGMILPMYLNVTKEYIEREHRANRKVIPWTANTAESIRALAQWGADGIITDRPDLAVKTLRLA